jgi:F-type H+-transporting ATPase subunit b
MLLAATGDWVWWAFDLAFWTAVVFVILVVVLAWFAGSPLVEAMRQRQSEILERVSRAEQARKEVEQLLQKQDEERTKSRAAARALIREAKSDADRVRLEVVARARTEAERMQQRAEREIGLLRHKAVYELWVLATDLSASAAEQMVRNELSPDDRRRLVDAAIAEISAATGDGA